MPTILPAAIIAAALVLGTSPATAQVNHTQVEIAMLPDYCQARLIGNEQQRNQWLQRMGQNFYHLHHYCSGLTAMRRASTAVDMRTRNGHLEFAVQEFNYVIRGWSPDFYLVKSAQQNKAMALAMLGRPVQ